MVWLSPTKGISRPKHPYKGAHYISPNRNDNAVVLTEPINFRMVGKPYLIVLRQSCPSSRHNPLTCLHRTLYVLPITESVDVMGSRKWPSRLTDIIVRHRV